MICDICGGQIDGQSRRFLDIHGHEGCIDRLIDKLLPAGNGSPASWDTMCPNISPSGSKGRVVRKAIVED